MARGVRKTGRSVGPVSKQLEEFFPINFDIVGRPEWIRASFTSDAATEDQKIYISDPTDLKPIHDWLKSLTYHILDTETWGPGKYGGLEPRNPGSKITMLQMGDKDRVVILDPELIPEFKEELESEDFLHILQNAIFDFKFLLEKKNVHLNRIYCTMLTEQLLTSGRMGVRVGMPDIVRRYYPHRLITKELRKQFIEWNGVFTKKMTWYGARDIAALDPVVPQQCKEIARFKMQDCVQDEFDVIPCTAMIELGGVPMDVRTLRLAVQWWQMREVELVNEIMTMYDRRVASSGEKSLFLFEDFKEVFKIKSPGAKLEALKKVGIELDDTKRDTLETVNDPLTKLLVEYSEVAKITSTYGDNLIARIDPQAGRLYPEFNQLGSGDVDTRRGREKKSTIATGRYSSDFQQLPRSEEKIFVRVVDQDEEALVRSQFSEKIRELVQEEIPV